MFLWRQLCTDCVVRFVRNLPYRSSKTTQSDIDFFVEPPFESCDLDSILTRDWTAEIYSRTPQLKYGTVQ